MAEAVACRRAAALFDFSFLAVAEVSGPQAIAALSTMSGRPVARLPIGAIYYGVRRKPDRTLAADLTVWRLDADRFWLMSGRQQDVTDLCAAEHQIACRDLTERTAVFALQGPGSAALLTTHAGCSGLTDLAYFCHMPASLFGMPCTLGRLGYTGELGFELVTPARYANDLWRHLAPLATPAGFAAANILRIEAGFLLFTHELSVPVRAHEVGLANLLGPEPKPPRVRLCCFTAAPRESFDADFWRPGPGLALPETPGNLCVTSAALSPIAQRILGLGYIHANQPLNHALIDTADNFTDIEIVSLPYYDTHKRIPRRALRDL